MLHQLSGLSSPPLPSTPLTVVTSGHHDHDLAALRTVAPNAVVRGGSLGAPANGNTVVVLDRCGRMVYQQRLQQSDTDFQSVEAAILSAHLDEPCGPCHLPVQEQPSYGRSNQSQDKTTSQAKMSSIANAYGSSRVANNPPEARHEKAVVEETAPYDHRDELDEETISVTTRKPERKKKKKDKLKKGKHEKQKKRKRVDDAETSTSKPTEAGSNDGCDRDCDARDCDCDVRAKDFDDEIDKLIGASETANEILRPEESAPGPFLPNSMIIWADDERYSRQDKRKKQNKKNGKRARVDLEREIDEGIEMVREEEFVEDPDAIGGDDNVLAAIEKAVGEVRASETRQGSENGLSREDGGAAFSTGDDRVLATDDWVALLDETVYQREREQEMSTGELTGVKNVRRTHTRDESQDAAEKKSRKKSKQPSKKVTKTKMEEGGKYKRVEEIQEEERNVEDRWVGLHDANLHESYVPWPVEELDVGIVAERETDGGQFAEREMDEGRFAERKMDGDQFAGKEIDSDRFAGREMDGGQFAEREMDGGQFAEREMDSDQFVEREMDGGQFAEREMDGDQFAERETDDGQFADREMDGDQFAEREMDSGQFAEREMDGGRFAERETDRGTMVERQMDGDQVAEGEMDGDQFVERETDGGRFTEGESESAPRYVTWREMTAAPTEHASSSSGGDSSDRNSRLAVYESEGDYSTSDKVEQLHSKVKPWGKAKHY